MFNSFTIFGLILFGIIGATINHILNVRYRPLFLTVYSLVIYTIWAKWTVIILLAEMVIVWILSKRMVSCNSSNKKRTMLAIGVVFIVSILAFYKYIPFFSDIYAKNSIIVPLGISYYSFKMISYMVDSYREGPLTESLYMYLTYISFFPQIASGPISRFDELLIKDEVKIDRGVIFDSLCRIVRGLFYKLVIADRLTVYTSTIFSNYDQYNSLALIMALSLFSIQIYGDFAGYSDIAIGICGLYGFRIRDNFNLPYFSRSIREYWNRWHISLSSWLRDYIYIPLGGNRKGKTRKIINVFVVFLISGIWHGSTIGYILWGLWHGLWNVLSPKSFKNKGCEIASTIVTFILVSLGWPFFKLNTVSDAFYYLAHLFTKWELTVDGIVNAVMPFSGDYSCVAKLLTIIIMCIVMFIMEYYRYTGRKINRLYSTIVYMILVVLFGIVGSGSFIYANY